MDKSTKIEVIIIGAGLTGLATAVSLLKQGQKSIILESRSRIGGRIHTLGFSENKPVEMGATWLGKQHINLNQLLSELGLETFPQIMGDHAFIEPLSTNPPILASIPQNEEATLRIKGGTENLIRSLEKKLARNNIFCSQEVISIKSENDYLEVKTDNKIYHAKKVISTLPPNLLIHKIAINPPLPLDIQEIAKTTHTWMGESIKVAITYPSPFWKAKPFSGTILSNVGPITEMYDHCNYENSHFSLMGFFNGNYHNLTKQERLDKIIFQLKKYYGKLAEDYTDYNETVWCKEKDTFTPYSISIIPHQNNGHAVYLKTYLNDRLIIAGTETSSNFPGYMEGAIYSAMKASKMLLKTI